MQETKDHATTESTTLKAGTAITVNGVPAWLDAETKVRSEAQHIEQLKNALPDQTREPGRETARSGSTR